MNRPVTLSVHKHKRILAFTLIEISLTLLVVALIYTTVMPAYMHMSDSSKSNKVEEELEELSTQIKDYFNKNGDYPDSLADIVFPVPLDPWGNPFQYTKIKNAGSKSKGKLRKDKNLVPINSDYDLYSMGPDGKSVPPLTGMASKDDIIRGRNGLYYGPADEY